MQTCNKLMDICLSEIFTRGWELDTTLLILFYFVADIQKAITVRQKLDAQLNENTLVKEVKVLFSTSKITKGNDV